MSPDVIGENSMSQQPDLTPEEVARREEGEILDLIPPKGIPVEERARRNAIIREKLPLASDLTLVWLLQRGHQLSEREFYSRLKGQKVTQMEALFKLMEGYAYEQPDPLKNFLLAHDNATRCALTTAQGEMVRVFIEYIRSPLEKQLWVFVKILSCRPDIEEILAQLKVAEKGNYSSRWVTV